MEDQTALEGVLSSKAEQATEADVLHLFSLEISDEVAALIEKKTEEMKAARAGSNAVDSNLSAATSAAAVISAGSASSAQRKSRQEISDSCEPGSRCGSSM
jgi:hypothetical protein